MRREILAANWKMNHTNASGVAMIKELAPLVKDAKAEVVVCAPYLMLTDLIEAAKGTNIGIGAENIYFEDKGAFTGEVSAPMLKEIGVEYVIIGHSERRQYFNETDETVNKKVHKAFEYGFTPIVCVGESLEQRDYGVTNDLVRYQTKIALFGLDVEQVKKVVIAYEPVWAIGTGRTATSEQAEEVCKAIRDCVAELYGQSVADEVRVQYGGSMKPSNAEELLAQPNIDGGLIGGASLVADDFSKLIR